MPVMPQPGQMWKAPARTLSHKALPGDKSGYESPSSPCLNPPPPIECSSRMEEAFSPAQDKSKNSRNNENSANPMYITGTRYVILRAGHRCHSSVVEIRRNPTTFSRLCDVFTLTLAFRLFWVLIRRVNWAVSWSGPSVCSGLA